MAVFEAWGSCSDSDRKEGPLFVHNHPSGDPDASREDIETTARLLEVARLVGIRVLDHVIVGESSYLSFVDEGLM